MSVGCFFFCRQNTEYEMRISDWSSDVCSSDLLLKKRAAALEPLHTALEAVDERLATCSICGNVDTTDPCGICADPRRDDRALCVVEDVADLWALERSRLFPGKFHVLGGRL